MSSAAPTGIHGKLPARGDFITRNLPRSFVGPWDEWLQAGMAASREQLGDGWLALYLESPIWRFALAPDVCGPESWVGVLLPSVDKVGRYFPLTIACPLDSTAHPLVTAVTSQAWFESVESLALRALEDDRLDLEAFVADVAALPVVPSAIATPSDHGSCATLDGTGSIGIGLASFLERHLTERDQSYSLWWTNGSPQVPAHCCLLESLPPAERFSHLLTGSTTSTG